MATVTIYTNPNRLDRMGRMRIVIQVTHNRVPYRYTLFTVKPGEWDARKQRVNYTNHNYLKLNQTIIESISILDMAMLSPRSKINIKEILHGKPEESTSFIYWFNEYLNYCQENTSIGYFAHVQALKEKIAPGLTMADITERFIKVFIKRNRDRRPNTIAGYIKKIRAVVRYAMQHGASVNHEIFSYKIKREQTIKRKLSIDQIKKIEQLPFDHTDTIGLVRDAFMLQIYLLGMRIGDLLMLQHTDVNNNRITIRQRKTDTPVTVHLIPEAVEIINKHAGGSQWYVMPFMELAPTDDPKRLHFALKAKTSLINKYLKIIAAMIGFQHPLSSHIARHSFAVFAKHSGLSIGVISKFLGHSSERQTETYINEIMEQDDLDEAADLVFTQMRQRADK